MPRTKRRWHQKGKQGANQSQQHHGQEGAAENPENQQGEDDATHPKRSRAGSDAAAVDVDDHDRRGDAARGWKHFPTQNALFEQYYQGLGIVPEGEWDAFLAALRRPLPTTTRVTATFVFAPAVRAQLENFGRELKHVQVDGTPIPPPRPLPWYSDAWHFEPARQLVRKDPRLKQFQDFLTRNNEQGGISRQEAVSMVPVFFLDVAPGMRVVDMCAAPGSKTAQIIELLHAPQPGVDSHVAGTGRSVVVANDVDEKRCYMLVHQTARLGSPAVAITNHEAQHFPVLKANGGFQFDRVLADVPCSGDGTLRKNPDLWARWQPNLGLGLHRLQLSIATRGVQLLAVGGRLVYSTCSLNPVEDEAVVAELLRRCGGALELMDVSAMLPGLVRQRGLSTWRVMDKQGKWYSTLAEVPADSQRNMFPSAFAPPAGDPLAPILTRCMRILPHTQDTGGFFVAVFRKVAPWPNNPAGPALAATVASTAPAAPTPTPAPAAPPAPVTPAPATTADPSLAADLEEEAPSRPSKEAPFLPLSESMLKDLAVIRDFYGLDDKFPYSQLIARSEHSPKIYLISAGIQTLLNLDSKRSLRMVNTGVKVFVRHEGQGNGGCDMRVAYDGVEYVHEHMQKRVVPLSALDFARLLQTKDVPTNQFAPATQEALATFDLGCCVFRVHHPDTLRGRFAATAWRGRNTCHLLIPKTDLAGISPFFAAQLAELNKLKSAATSAAAPPAPAAVSVAPMAVEAPKSPTPAPAQQ